jgi:hypothetical protein
MGFCEYGIKEFCTEMKININDSFTKKEFFLICQNNQLGLLSLLGEYMYEISEIIPLSKIQWDETAIAESAKYSYWYAESVIKGRFELGEAAIKETPIFEKWYQRTKLFINSLRYLK